MDYDLVFWAGLLVQPRDLFGVEPELDCSPRLAAIIVSSYLTA